MLSEAIVTYREAIAHESNFPEAYNNLVRPPSSYSATSLVTNMIPSFKNILDTQYSE